LATSYEDEIDAVFRRTQQTIDVDKIKSKSQLKAKVRAFKEAQGKPGGWSTTLNSLIWDRIKTEREQGAEYYINRAITQSKSIVIGMNKAATKVFSAVFNKKLGSAQVVARDKKTGRFTSFKASEVSKIGGK